MEREKARGGDVTVTLVWDDWNDLDLHLTTPTGAHIYYGAREADGGTLDVDMNGGGPASKEPIENVFFGDAERGIEAMKGKYTVVVQNYAYHRCPEQGPVPFRVLVRKNGEVSEFRGKTEAGKTGSESDVKVVEFEYHGRAVAAPLEAPSAMEASNLVALTTSVGSTLDALGALMRLGEEVAEMERTRALVQEDHDMDMPEAGSNAAPAAAAAGQGAGEAAATAPPDDGARAQHGLASGCDEGGNVMGSMGEVAGPDITQAPSLAELPQGRQVTACDFYWCTFCRHHILSRCPATVACVCKRFACVSVACGSASRV